MGQLVWNMSDYSHHTHFQMKLDSHSHFHSHFHFQSHQQTPLLRVSSNGYGSKLEATCTITILCIPQKLILYEFLVQCGVSIPWNGTGPAVKITSWNTLSSQHLRLSDGMAVTTKFCWTARAVQMCVQRNAEREANSTSEVKNSPLLVQI